MSIAVRLCMGPGDTPYRTTTLAQASTEDAADEGGEAEIVALIQQAVQQAGELVVPPGHQLSVQVLVQPPTLGVRRGKYAAWFLPGNGTRTDLTNEVLGERVRWALRAIAEQEEQEEVDASPDAPD